MHEGNQTEAFSIEGAVTFETVARIQKSVMNLLSRELPSAVYQVNLAGITLVNSAALALLVELKKKVLAQKKAVTFLNPPERLVGLAQVCGVADWLGLDQTQ